MRDSEVTADQKGSGVPSSALLMSFLVAIVAKSIDLMFGLQLTVGREW
jgi:hypothetical protein